MAALLVDDDCHHRNAIYIFGKPYARRDAVLPGKFVRVLKIEGKCSCLRAKAAHISGHLPIRQQYLVNWAKVRTNQRQ